ncbi:hypothetical protein, partial [Sneathiella chinensis]
SPILAKHPPPAHLFSINNVNQKPPEFSGQKRRCRVLPDFRQVRPTASLPSYINLRATQSTEKFTKKRKVQFSVFHFPAQQKTNFLRAKFLCPHRGGRRKIPKSAPRVNTKKYGAIRFYFPHGIKW